jgi:hypothetical protein
VKPILDELLFQVQLRQNADILLSAFLNEDIRGVSVHLLKFRPHALAEAHFLMETMNALGVRWRRQ